MIKTSILDIIFFFLGSTTCFTKIYSSIAGKGDASGVYVPCDVFLAIHQKKNSKVKWQIYKWHFEILWVWLVHFLPMKLVDGSEIRLRNWVFLSSISLVKRQVLCIQKVLMNSISEPSGHSNSCPHSYNVQQSLLQKERSARLWTDWQSLTWTPHLNVYLISVLGTNPASLGV